MWVLNPAFSNIALLGGIREMTIAEQGCYPTILDDIPNPGSEWVEHLSISRYLIPQTS
jgi:hypothetical protein